MNVAHAVWTRPQLVAEVKKRLRNGRAEVLLHVPGLVTPEQAVRLEQHLHAVPGVVRVQMDRHVRRLRISFDDARTQLPRLLEVCAAAGCPGEPLHADRLDNTRRHEANAALKRLAVAGILAMQTMMFASVLYLSAFDTVDALTMEFFRWLTLASATPVVFYSALPFFRHAWTSLRQGRPGIDVPVALAILLIYGGSVLAFARGSGEVYFDSLSMFVFVLLLGRYLELHARQRHAALCEATADALPLIAFRYAVDDELIAVAVAELQPGNRIRVSAGGIVPADGYLDCTRGRVDTAMLSGESRPRTIGRREVVAAGSVVVDEPLDLVVQHRARDSAAARLGVLAQTATRQRDDSGDNESPAARRFVVRVLFLAAATVAFWLWRDPSRAFDAAVAVLVVACPCAFGLAAPATLARAMVILARRGVFVARPAALQTLARINQVFFDKTGTLTQFPAASAPDTEMLRPGAVRTVDALREVGLRVAIISGDSAQRVRAAADRLRISDWRAGQSPEDKYRRVREAQQKGGCILMVGDGSNDAAALAAADVSATVTGGTALARSHADLVLTSGIGELPAVRTFAIRAAHLVQQNRRWALAYNLCAVPFAAAGFVPPWLAAIGMSLSSLAVVLNSLRLRNDESTARPPAVSRPREATA